MFKKILILFTISISQILFCQQGWYQLTSGTSSNLRSVYFSDVNTGYAVGYTGTIIKTTNGGTNWAAQQSGTAGNLYSVYFLGQTGFAAGGGAVILKTTNGGLNWFTQSVPVTNDLNSIFMTDTSTTYIAANWGKILKTTNGGINWFVQYNDNNTCYYSIFFINPTTGFASGLFCLHAGGTTLSTSNGGTNWNSIGGEGASIYFINSTTGYREWVGIYKTTNGGTNWMYQTLGTSLLSVWFANETTGYTAGYLYPNIGKVFKTTNSGSNWFEQNIPLVDRLYSVFFINSNTGYTVGNAGTILKTTNGGVTGLVQTNEVAKEYKLYQNYPNPFNPATKIKFEIPNSKTESKSKTEIRIYDILGREIVTLVNEELRPGTYEVEFDAASFSSGIYYCKLTTGSFSETMKMALIK